MGAGFGFLSPEAGEEGWKGGVVLEVFGCYFLGHFDVPPFPEPAVPWILFVCLFLGGMGGSRCLVVFFRLSRCLSVGASGFMIFFCFPRSPVRLVRMPEREGSRREVVKNVGIPSVGVWLNRRVGARK